MIPIGKKFLMRVKNDIIIYIYPEAKQLSATQVISVFSIRIRLSFKTNLSIGFFAGSIHSRISHSIMYHKKNPIRNLLTGSLEVPGGFEPP